MARGDMGRGLAGCSRPGAGELDVSLAVLRARSDGHGQVARQRGISTGAVLKQTGARAHRARTDLRHGLTRGSAGARRRRWRRA